LKNELPIGTGTDWTSRYLPSYLPNLLRYVPEKSVNDIMKTDPNSK